MTASRRLAARSQASSRSQHREPGVNVAADSPTLKTTRASRSSNKTAELEANGIGNKETPGSPVKRKKIEAVITEEVSPAEPKESTPKKTKLRKEVKQETQEHEPSAEETSTKGKQKPRVNKEQVPADPQINGEDPKAAKRKRTVKAEKAEIELGEPSPKKTKRKKDTEVEVEVDENVVDEASPKKAARKTKVKEEEEEVEEGEEGQKKTKRKRKTKEERELEAMPLAARTDGLRMFIGAHVSGAKGRSFSMYIAPVELRLFNHLGVHNSVTNCVHIGGNAFAMFLKSQKKWENPPLQDDHREQFKVLCSEHRYEAARYGAAPHLQS